MPVVEMYARVSLTDWYLALKSMELQTIKLTIFIDIVSVMLKPQNASYINFTGLTYLRTHD